MKIACDFDRTLSYYYGKESFNCYKFGPPIISMLNRIKHYLSEGHEIIIFTARTSPHPKIKEWNEEKVRIAIQDWLEENGLPRLSVTHLKTNDIDVFLDDKAVGILANNGCLTLNEKLLPKTY